MGSDTPGAALAELIRYCRFRFTREEELQRGIATALDSMEIEYQREARIGVNNRIDFLVGRIGIEVKIDGSGPAVARQLRRYARCEEIDELILVTSRTRHFTHRHTIEDKPVHVAWLSIHAL